MIEKSRAEDLFEALREEGRGAVDRLIADRSAEELFLDLKRSADNGSGNWLHNTDRRNLSKAVCGFGTTAIANKNKRQGHGNGAQGLHLLSARE